MPMWCTSSDSPRPPQGIPEAHHRIVRIPPGESVVLNSAERAPYLLLIEIVHSDLDFDPSKRGNREVLKKFIAKEDGRPRPPYETNGNPSHGIALAGQESTSIPGDKTQLAFGVDDPDPSEEEGDSPGGPPSYAAQSPSDDEEEMDLIEQLYGTDESIRSRPLDLSETIVLPPPPKNRELDMATWSRSSSTPHSPIVQEELEPSPPITTHRKGVHSMHRTTSSKSSIKPIKTLSLDEYSERMRTAAVMLAQLNANLVREPATTLVPPGTPVIPDTPSPLRWLPGSSWLVSSNVSTPVRDENRQGSDSLTVSTPGPSSGVPMRLKLQHAEAAAIRSRIMEEMLALEEERMERMRENRDGEGILRVGDMGGKMRTAEDEGIIRRELSKVDPSAVVFSESWATKKVSATATGCFVLLIRELNEVQSRIRQASPYGHLGKPEFSFSLCLEELKTDFAANWDCVSVIVKTGGDLRQEQLAVQLIQAFENIWKEENCHCWVR